MKTIDNKNRVDSETLKVYDEIDGLRVIEEYLLFKGTESNRKTILLKELEEIALITYGLKSNATNKLYVGWHLDKFYKRHGLFTNKMNDVSIPADIFKKVDALHQQFKSSELIKEL